MRIPILSEFTEKEAQLKKEGRWFQVTSMGKILGTFWGLDEHELRTHLIKELPPPVVKKGFTIRPLA